MSYLSRLVEHSQLDVAGERTLKPATAMLSEDQQTDIVEIDTVVESAPTPITRTLGSVAIPAPRAALDLWEPVPHPSPSAVSPPPEPGATVAVETLPPVSTTSSSGDRALSVPEQAESTTSSDPPPSDAPPPAHMLLQHVVEWVRAGAASESTPPDERIVWFEHPALPSRPTPVTLTVEQEPEQPTQSASGATDPAPVAASSTGSTLSPVEPLVRAPRALDVDMPPTISSRSPIEDVVEVSIGTINVRLEAPPPVRDVVAPRKTSATPERREQPSSTRLARYYLRV